MPPRTAKPPAYPPDVDISAIREELELSTFLNKGVLQSNSELKLRIVELERENRTLRLAESALASAEDRLETAEKRVRQLEGELADRERELEERETEVEDKIKDALKAKEGLERENKQLRGMVREWREIGGSFVRRVGGALGLDVGGAGELRRGEQALGTDAEGDDERAAPTQASGERSGLSRPATPPVSAAPSGSRAPEGKLARVVKRDIPRQRTTTRDTSTSASRKQEEDAEHNVPPVRKPVERTYRTRTTGPAPAFLRGDLRDSMGGENAVAGPSSVKRSAPQRPSRACENHTPTPVAKSNHQTSSANNRKRSRIIESQSNEGSEQEDGNLVDDDDGALGHDARPRGSKHPRTAARRVVGQYTVQDEDQVDPMDEESDEEYGQADEDEEGPEVDGEDDGEAATSDNDRAHSPLPAEKRHKTASRISPSRRRPSGSARVESTAIAGSNTRTSRPSQIRSAPRPSDLDTHPSDRHTPSHARTASGGPSSGPSTRVAGSSAKKKPVGESTASRRISTTAHEASSKASHPALASVRDKDRSGYRVKTEPSERVSAKAPAGKDYWGQPIIVKRERISLSPDEPDVAPQGDDGYEYGSDDDPLAGDI